MTEKIVDGEIDTTDTSARYLALLGRIRPVLLPATRYLAYTSDIGEAFRPIVNRRVVSAAYGVSIAYVVGDIGFEGYKAHLDRQERLTAGDKESCSASTEIGLRVARRTVFQGLASIVLPAVTIHSAVKYSAPLFLKSQNPRIKGWGPTVVGLAIVPALPVMFDHPVETATDKVFDWVEENWIGSTAEAQGRRRKEHEKSEL
ncbi:hypothetical protein P389DRAFT_183757 [Cystobasidium minutum MCA 4210]|uniref:uncharacterized protein n=1 Tax=Cystobasidium minutum MCA 4210 TaxID=1397322 RepID=UPI0034CEF3D0|eukprot:jgi/Rhomi1/183757/fgenesh1_pm.4_\